MVGGPRVGVGAGVMFFLELGATGGDDRDGSGKRGQGGGYRSGEVRGKKCT